MRSALVALIVVASPSLARAQPATEPAPAPAASPLAEPAPALDPALTAAPPSAADAARRAARKERFELHRSVGFVVEAMMLGSTALYILDDVDRFGGGVKSGSFTIPTLTLAATAQLGMLINVLLAFTAPPRSGSVPTLNIVHQLLVYGAGAANIVRFILGVALAGVTTTTGNEGLITAYRVTSITAPVLFATAMTLKLF